MTKNPFTYKFKLIRPVYLVSKFVCKRLSWICDFWWRLNRSQSDEQAELRKIHKYRHLTDFHFIPIGAETLGPFGPHVVHFLKDLGNKISKINGERRSKSFLFQSIGIAIQRGNASCVMGTTGSMGKLEELNYL